MIFKAQGQCPRCAQKGKNVALKKMKHHVDDISFLRDEFDYYICKNESCDIVYFSIVSEFSTQQLNKEVGYKKSASDSANICYCYNIKKSDLNEHTLGFIETKMEEYPSSCGIRNPYGVCCTGAIKKMQKNLS